MKIRKEGVILRPTKLKFENLSAFNPGIYQEGEYVHMLYRAQNLDHKSSLGYARLKGPFEIVERWKKPFLAPQYDYDSHGVEDARIVRIGKTFYLTYVAHDGKNAVIAYAAGTDLFNLERHGVISPLLSYNAVGRLFNSTTLDDKYYFFKSYYKDTVARDVLLWDKDGFLFPEKISGRFAFVHRILPDMQVIYFDHFNQLKDQNFWRQNIKRLAKFVILEGEQGFEARNVGGGAPPIKTRYGWLFIYHGVEPINKGRIYHAAAALVDLKKPTRVTHRLPYPLFSPEEEFERQGHTHNVVFPTGAARFRDRLFIYYGAADSFVAVASVNLNSLLKELLKYRSPRR